MWRTVLTFVATLVFASIGLYLGHMIHGTSWKTVVTTASGGLGGCGIGILGVDLCRKHRAVHHRV
jgi:hypothetical protein